MKTELIITKKGKKVKLRDNIKDKIYPTTDFDEEWNMLRVTTKLLLYAKFTNTDFGYNQPTYIKALNWFDKLGELDKIMVIAYKDKELI